MAKYIVEKGIVLVDGKSYRLNDEVELTDKQAKDLGDSVKSVTAKKAKQKADNGVTPYDDMKRDELIQLAEDLNIEVEGTGKNGAIKNEDYINALKEA